MKKHKPSEKMPAPSRHVVIKFKGDDLDWHRAFFGPLAKDFILWGDYSISADQIEWWADPLEEEAQEPQQPDGYCAWHPEKGYPDRGRGGPDITTLAGSPEESESLLVNEGPYGRNYEDLADYEFAVMDAKNKGWRIRPVKLVFLDEENLYE